MANLNDRVDQLEAELRALKAEPFRNLSSNDVETIKKYIFERTATNVSGTIDGALIVTLNGKRRVIPTYPDFPTTP